MNNNKIYISNNSSKNRKTDLTPSIRNNFKKDRVLDFVNKSWLNKELINLELNDNIIKIISFNDEDYQKNTAKELRNLLNKDKNILEDISNNKK